jgi:hypothetical protein
MYTNRYNIRHSCISYYVPSDGTVGKSAGSKIAPIVDISEESDIIDSKSVSSLLVIILDDIFTFIILLCPFNISIGKDFWRDVSINRSFINSFNCKDTTPRPL